MVQDLQDIRATLDSMLQEMVEQFYETVPSAQHLAAADTVNRAYYIRFTIEIILRLRMKRTIDALTIHYFTKCAPPLAKKWCEYTEDEMLHDSMFLRDLETLGVDRQSIYSTEPFFSTKLLQGYFYYGLEHESRPLASLASSYYIEYMSGITQRGWLENVSKTLGADAVRGSLAHVTHDEKGDHVDFVWDILSTFIQSHDDVAALFDHVRNVNCLFMMFFRELHEHIQVKNAPSLAAVPAE